MGASTELPQITIENTDIRTLSSSYVEQTFQVFVALPGNYAASAKAYPVLYMLDANESMGIVTETVRLLQFGQELPNIIIVGIGFPTKNILEQLVLRNRYYTPSVDEESAHAWLDKIARGFGVTLGHLKTGEAGKFLQFITAELMPFIHAHYRVNPEDKAFMGHSLGGLFGLYTLFHRADTFNRYILGSPSIWWDDKIIMTHEADYAAHNSHLSARVFMSVGALEEVEHDPKPSAMITNMKHLAETMIRREYDGLELTTHILENETHLSVILALMSRGLRVVFAS
jgi:predicted alpha/beta superfamily hydrolase